MDISQILPLIMAMNNGNNNQNNMLTSLLPQLLNMQNGQNNGGTNMNNMLLNMLTSNFNNQKNAQQNEFNNSGTQSTPGVATPYPNQKYSTPFSTMQTPANPPSAQEFPPHINPNNINAANASKNGEQIYPTSNLQTNNGENAMQNPTPQQCENTTLNNQQSATEATKKEADTSQTYPFGFKRVN